MKQIKTFPYLLLIMSFFISCNEKQEKEESSYLIPGLDSIYNRIVEVYGKKGELNPATGSNIFYRQNSPNESIHVIYKPNEDKIEVTVIDRLPDDQTEISTVEFSKGNKSISKNDISFAKWVKGKYFPINPSKDEVESLLRFF